MTTNRTPKPKRYEYHVTYDAANGCWVCKVGGALFGFTEDRQLLISDVSDFLIDFAEFVGQHSELIIHRKDGTIGKGSSSRRTYGGDDPKSKG